MEVEATADEVVVCTEDVDAFELEVAVVAGLADVTVWLKLVEIVDTVEPVWLELVEIFEIVDAVEPEDAKRVEVMELDVPVESELVIGVESAAFADIIELSPIVIPSQTT